MWTLALKVGGTYFLDRIPVTCVNIQKNRYEFEFFLTKSQKEAFRIALNAHQVETLLETYQSGKETEIFHLHPTLVDEIEKRILPLIHGYDEEARILQANSFPTTGDSGVVKEIRKGVYFAKDSDGIVVFPYVADDHFMHFRFCEQVTIYFTQRCVIFVENMAGQERMSLYFIDRDDNPSYLQNLSRWFR